MESTEMLDLWVSIVVVLLALIFIYICAMVYHIHRPVVGHASVGKND